VVAQYTLGNARSDPPEFHVDIAPTWTMMNGPWGAGELGKPAFPFAWATLAGVSVAVLVVYTGDVVCAEAIPTTAVVNSTSAAPSDMSMCFKVTLL
jgi:hypothetical protein